MKTRRQLIIDTIEDLAGEFLYYGRKEDEDLPRGEIEAAFAAGEITIEEMTVTFQARLEAVLKPLI